MKICFEQNWQNCEIFLTLKYLGYTVDAETNVSRGVSSKPGLSVFY